MPDNFIQQPENTQNYNRYAYVLNNPLMYTDPSGESLIGAVLIGALIAATTYTMTALLADVPFSVGGLVKATFIGAASAAVTFGIGSATANIGNFLIRSTVQAVAHGTFQGTMTAISGGKFWSGFAAGALSSIASSAFGQGFNHEGLNADGSMINPTQVWGGAGNFANSGAGMIAFSTVVGGASAKLTGGNFWQGAVTGLVVSGLNHEMHKMDNEDGIDPPGKKAKDPKFFDRLRKHYESKSEDDFNLTTKEFKYLITKGVINYKKAVKINDNTYRASINFYDSDMDLKLSFGRATITYRIENNNRIYSTFYDKYDFDSKPWGTRSVVNEVITRAYNSYSDGKSFNIYYNKR